jgi:uncharacterized protein with PQ loop repeat
MIYFPSYLKHRRWSVEESQPTYSPLELRSPIAEEDQKSLWLVSRVAAFLSVCYTLIGGCIVLLGYQLRWMQSLATLFGTIATITACIQYLPQLIRTFRRKSPGALSIITMLIQTPGTVLLIIVLMQRPGINWTTYLSYALAAFCQGTLLVMSIWYTIIPPRSALSPGASNGSRYPDDYEEYEPFLSPADRNAHGTSAAVAIDPSSDHPKGTPRIGKPTPSTSIPSSTYAVKSLSMMESGGAHLPGSMLASSVISGSPLASTWTNTPRSPRAISNTPRIYPKSPPNSVAKSLRGDVTFSPSKVTLNEVAAGSDKIVLDVAQAVEARVDDSQGATEQVTEANITQTSDLNESTLSITARQTQGQGRGRGARKTGGKRRKPLSRGRSRGNSKTDDASPKS